VVQLHQTPVGLQAVNQTQKNTHLCVSNLIQFNKYNKKILSSSCHTQRESSTTISAISFNQ
jgi:hypothetical protein